MKTTSEKENLLVMIQSLKHQQAIELEGVQEQIHLAYESLKPLNIIKSTFFEATSSPDIKHNLMNGVIGLATGYASKKLLFGTTHNPIKKIVGSLLQYVVTNLVGRRKDSE